LIIAVPIQELALLLPGAAVALGAMFAAKSLSLRRQSAACAGWPTAAGKIVGARTETEIEDDSTESDDHDVRPARVLSAASVRYVYRVGDREYQSTRLYAGRPVFYGNPRVAAAIIAKYPPNAAVSVYYNPANPAEAMLEPLNFANANLALGVALGFGGCGLLGLFVLWSVQ
jgi:hypothetical protein